MERDTENLERFATEVAPCGCRFGTTPDSRFVFIPCALTCPTYAYAMDESVRQGKPTETRRAP